MKTCPVCNAQLDDEVAFCTQCGAPQAAASPVEPQNQPQAEAAQSQPDVNQPNAAADTPNGANPQSEPAYQQSNPAYGQPNGAGYGQPNGTPYGQANGAAYGQPNGGAYGQPGAAYNAGGAYNPNGTYVPPVNPYDHTADFDQKDISDNKVLCMLPYLIGWFGILLALVAAKDSPYVSFHVRQAMKIEVTQILLLFIAGILFITFVIPIACGVCIGILFVLRIISFFQICSGKAKEVAILRSFAFFR